MKQGEIDLWLRDESIIESYKIASGLIVAARQEAALIRVYALSSTPKTPIEHITSELTLQSARDAIAEYGAAYLVTWEKRRLQAPTPAQLSMLFSWKIPIDVDLTFGRAWDIIDERMQAQK